MRRGYVVGVAAGLWLVSCVPAQAVVLRYRPTVGEVVKHKISMAGRMETTMAGMGQSMRMEMTGTIDYAEEALSETEETTRVENRWLGGKMSVRMNGESQSEDMPTGRLVVELDRRGRMVKMVEAEFGGESLTQGMMGPDLENLPTWSQFGAFPEEDVKVDDAWSEELEFPAVEGGPELTLVLNSRLLALTTFQERKCAKIRTTFEGPLAFDLSEMAPAEEEVEGTMEAVLQGDMMWYYDYENSVYVYAEGAVGMDMAMSMAGPEMPGGEMNMNMLMNMKYVLVE
jgi:hypothetical protein